MIPSLNGKLFIKKVYIEELSAIVKSFPYQSFIMIGIGIELLGKCIEVDLQTWDTPGRSKHFFEKAINELDSFAQYRQYLTSHNLYGAYRCGLAHSSRPDYAVTLSSKNELGNLIEHNGRINLKVEDLYHDFREACQDVISRNYPPKNKLNMPFLSVPKGSTTVQQDPGNESLRPN